MHDGGDQSRTVRTTEYADAHDTSVSVNNITKDWWLRSPASGYYGVSLVTEEGGTNAYSNGYNDHAVRPAMHVSMKDASIMSALSKKEEKEVATLGATWDSVIFGKYNGEDILWRVLSVDGNDVFLLSDRILFTSKYSYKEAPSTVDWENCSLRKYLNGDFYNEAFTDEEKSAIIKTETEKNLIKNIEDNIYLLSVKETECKEYGFPTLYYCIGETRKCYPTNSSRSCDWWLRKSSTDYSSNLFFANNDSKVETLGRWSDTSIYGWSDTSEGWVWYDSFSGVRPALHISLDSAAWEKYGEISSGDKINIFSETPMVTIPDEESNGTSDSGEKEIETPLPSSTPSITVPEQPSENETSDGNIAPDYYFNMEKGSDNVVAVAREGDTDNFTYDTSKKGGVLPTEEYAKEKDISLKYAAGKNGKALFLDRTQSYGAELKNINLGSGSWSVSFWMKTVNSLASFMPIFFTCSKDATQASTTKWVAITKTGDGWLNGYASPMIWSHNAELDKAEDDLCFPWYAYQNSDGVWVGDGDDSNAMAIKKDEWVHITLVVDTAQTFEYGDKNGKGYVNGPLTKTYVNGKLFGTGCVAPNTMSSTNKFFLGINCWDTPMKAYYDDVALWKRSLNADDVKLLYQAELEGKDITELNNGNGTEKETQTEEKNTSTDNQTMANSTDNNSKVDNNSKADNTSQADSGNSSPSASIKKETATTSSSTGTKLKTLKLSSVEARKGKKKITGKVSVSKAVVKIKVGKKSYKKATVKGKKFTLKTSKLKKKTKIIIKVTKKGYKTLKKTYKVK